MKTTVSIVGLGWLGTALAQSLINKGHKVKGTVTSAEKARILAGQGIETSVLKLTSDNASISDQNFFKTDVLFINIPPKRIEGIESIYPGQMEQLLPFIVQNNIKKVIFVSSTSVYPEVNRTVAETELEAPVKGSGVACLNAENILRQQEEFQTTVLRFGGLIGAERNPHRFMQRGIRNGAGLKPVNLIHQDDCTGIVHHVIENNIWGEVINACCPEHPTRKEFYGLAAEVAGVEKPVFDNDDSFQYKTVSSNKLIHQLGYRFKFYSPMDYIKSLQE